MHVRMLTTGTDADTAVAIDDLSRAGASGWTWVDVHAEGTTSDDVAAHLEGIRLDPIGLRDAVHETDLPKVDDFGSQLLVVLHGLRSDDIETSEVDCFVSGRMLVTVRVDPAPAVDALWDEVQANPAVASGTVDVLLARLADTLTRRLLAVLDEFDAQVDGLIEMALNADGRIIGEVTAIRADLSELRRVLNPQRETLDLLRVSESPLITEEGRRRFSDVFDVADRAVMELIGARSVLAETLDAYRGAEAREATDVTKVLTIYAAIMLPLSLVTGFFGMNFVSMPWLETEWGWVAVTGVMLAIAALSIGVFVSVGWIRRPSGREAGAALGRGLIEAARAPVQVTGAVFEISTMPIRATAQVRRRSRRPADPRDE